MERDLVTAREQPVHQLRMRHVVDGLRVDVRDEVVLAEASLVGGRALAHSCDHVLDGVVLGGLGQVDAHGADREPVALRALPENTRLGRSGIFDAFPLI